MRLTQEADPRIQLRQQIKRPRTDQDVHTVRAIGSADGEVEQNGLERQLMKSLKYLYLGVSQTKTVCSSCSLNFITYNKMSSKKAPITEVVWLIQSYLN